MEGAGTLAPENVLREHRYSLLPTLRAVLESHGELQGRGQESELPEQELCRGPGARMEVSPMADALTDALGNVAGGGLVAREARRAWGRGWHTSSQMCSEKMTERMPVDGYRPWPCSQLSKTYLMKAGW